MDIDIIKAIQRQTSIIAQALAVLSKECGGSYEIIDVERRFDWSNQPGRMIRIHLPNGPVFNVITVDSQILDDPVTKISDEPESADKDEIALWIRRRFNR